MPSKHYTRWATFFVPIFYYTPSKSIYFLSSSSATKKTDFFAFGFATLLPKVILTNTTTGFHVDFT